MKRFRFPLPPRPSKAGRGTVWGRAQRYNTNGVFYLSEDRLRMDVILASIRISGCEMRTVKTDVALSMRCGKPYTKVVYLACARQVHACSGGSSGLLTLVRAVVF